MYNCHSTYLLTTQVAQFALATNLIAVSSLCKSQYFTKIVAHCLNIVI